MTTENHLQAWDGDPPAPLPGRDTELHETLAKIRSMPQESWGSWWLIRSWPYGDKAKASQMTARNLARVYERIEPGWKFRNAQYERTVGEMGGTQDLERRYGVWACYEPEAEPDVTPEPEVVDNGERPPNRMDR